MDRVELEKGVFLHNSGAVYLQETGVAAVADLHIGYEAASARDGPFPRTQRKTLLERVRGVLSVFSPETMVVVGDLKHNFERNLHQEWDDVQEMLECITSVCNLVVTKGNHDNYLASILRRYDVPLVDRYDAGGVCFAHGHRNVEKEGLLVMGHEHPSIGIMDGVGGRLKLPCFLSDARNGVVVVPAMSPLATGTDVLRSQKFFSPVLNHISRERMRVWAISPIGLLSFGELGGLRSASEEW